MKKNESFYDKKGMLYVDCTECERGAFGSDEEKCSSGWKTKKKKVGGCFGGTLLKNIDPTKLKKL